MTGESSTLMPASTAERPRTVWVGIGLVAALALPIALAAVSSGGPRPPGDVFAPVNGAPITQNEFDWYASVFVTADGDMTAARDTVLLSLVNQELVAQEATRRSITVPAESLAREVTRIESTATHQSLAREGGVEGLRYRVNAFLLMRLVREVVVPPVTVSEADIVAAYRADPAYANVSLDEARPAIAEFLGQQAADRQWIDWLANARACSTIVVIDPSFQSFDRAPRATCAS